MHKNIKSFSMLAGILTVLIITLSGCSLTEKSPKEVKAKAQLSSNPYFIELQTLVTKQAGGRMVLDEKGKHFESSDYRIKNISGDTLTLEYDKQTLMTESSEVLKSENIQYEIYLNKISPDEVLKTKKLYGYYCVYIKNKDAVKPVIEDSYFKDEVVIPFKSRVYAHKAEKLIDKLVEEVKKNNP